MSVFKLNWRSFQIRWTHPEEGWQIVLLQAALLINAAVVVGRSGWVDVPASLAAVAVCGGFLGFLLAKTSCPDVIAHLTAAIVGLWAIGLQGLAVFPVLGASRQDRFAELIERVRVWYRGTTSGNQQDDSILFALALAFTLWLVSYLAVWTLFRRRWVLVSVLLPGLLVLVTLGYSPELGSVPLVIALLLSGTLSALFFAFRRDQVWRRFRIPSPQSMSRRVSRAGTVIVVAVLLLAWALPEVSGQDALARIRDRAQEPAESLSAWWLDSVPNWADDQDPSNSTYASFEDSFELGGGVQLSDDEAVALRGVPDPQYLVGMRYGVYTGRGWESDAASTFDPRGEYSPHLTLPPQQDVALSESVTESTEAVAGSITVVRPRGALVFTLDTYLRSDLATSVQLSWIQLENVAFDVRSADVPIDLRPISSLLLSTEDFNPANAGPGGSPLPNDDELATRLLNEREKLRNRFLDVTWVIDDADAITLNVNGQAPVYDDIEAVFARGPLSEGSRYQVTGLESQATPEDLRNADSSYPDYIEERYLGLPETVTDRTRTLAASIAGERTNGFDIALAIEREVRDRIRYSLEIDPPPDGQDVVDYVLFDSPIGYCEYHASAMAVLLRAAGIPSRVVVGYHQVAIDPANEAFSYRESDAHAWVEAFFPGFGWIPFEPTPSEPLREYGQGEREEPETMALPTSTPTPQVVESPVPTEEGTEESNPTSTPSAPAINQTTRTDSENGGWRDWAPWAIIAIILALSSLAWFTWTKPYRGLSPAGLLIFQTARFGKWLGVRRDPTMTPEEFAAELGRVVPAAKAPAHHVARLYVAERYGEQQLNREQHRSGERALRHLRRSLLRTILRRNA